MKKISILVSHPSRQHVHQLCYALQQKGYLNKFTTSIWYKPDSFPFTIVPSLPSFFKKRLTGYLLKRYFKPLNNDLIYIFPYSEFIYRVLSIIFKKENVRWISYSDRLYDWYVSRQITKEKVNIVIGYENASLLTFKAAKNSGKITVLDLAQVHHKLIEKLRDEYTDFRKTLSSDTLFAETNSLKTEHYKYTDYVFTLSTFARQTLVDAGFPESRIYTLNLGFDPNNFALKSQYNTSATFKLLFAGTLTKRKGIHLFLEALRQLSLPDIQLTLVGPVADAQDVLDLYEGEYVHIPFLPHNELVTYYQNADVFIFPSYLDGWAMVVLEAMACGTPVIISENTGAKDAVAKGGGFIIPIDNIDAIKEKILFFYYNRDQIKKIGLQAYEIAQTYTWQSYYLQVNKAVEDISIRESQLIYS
ncbi:glycosyltransferase family 4 protein [Rhodocytophaga rosea]|uniref:Glycosyltransferase family 4 protein n=1 Tax=Rhodocytophaga rosea TaxID=2704465 RepID=A0A6C0GCS6_9BACT|nr:glycosyltransferase family 4 protein [Rhodocytophaga rosea]QHT65766.1 glycosyltransferase family 4 protein [Rhodocytophaga rosea]